MLSTLLEIVCILLITVGVGLQFGVGYALIVGGSIGFTVSAFTSWLNDGAEPPK